jgi:cytoskeletal protein CcmA (bactofilin family)
VVLVSTDSANTYPEQVKETSESSAAQSLTEGLLAPATQAALLRHAYLDRGSKVEGKLNFERTARIDGQIDGEILAKDHLIIGESALVTAQIKATSVTVEGTVKGDIIAQHIEIRASAKISGKITSSILVVHEGAAFEGHCAMQPGKAHAVRQSTAFPKDELATEQPKDHH